MGGEVERFVERLAALIPEMIRHGELARDAEAPTDSVSISLVGGLFLTKRRTLAGPELPSSGSYDITFQSS